MRSYQKWAEINNIDLSKNGNAREKFITETMYILINRILLIRIAEDKNIIPRRISNGGIKDFKQFIRETKINYNKLLYIAFDTMREVYEHFFKEDIFDWYNPDSELLLRVLFIFNRYNFAHVNREILGNLYQRYIDREERKRLGQFYTPEEVVDYILDGVGYKGDQEIEGKTLLDPACGSGGFLVPAVNRLVERLRSKNFDAITILDKVRDNIYGFDINPFAAHLAETNLLFQVMDLISEAKKLDSQFKMDQFNVFVADSLKIPEEGQKEKQTSLFENNLTFSTASMDAEVVKDIKLKRGRFAGGVDFVVGNPPYGYREIFTPVEKLYLKKVYHEVYQGSYDFYQFFIKKGVDFLKESGQLGYIVSNTFLSKPTSTKLRFFLLNTNRINELFEVGQSVFDDPVIENVLLLLCKESKPTQKMKNEVSTKIGVLDKHAHKFIVEKEKAYLQEQFLKNPDHIFVIAGTDLLTKMKEQGIPLDAMVDISVGINTGNIGVREVLMSKERKNGTFHRLLKGRDTGRYSLKWEGDWVCYDPELVKSFGKKGRTLPHRKFFEEPKILIQRTRRGMKRKLNACFDEEAYYSLNRLTSIIKKDSRYLLRYILGLINSKLLDYYFQGMFKEYEVKPVFLKQLPIKPATTDQQQEVMKLVDQILQTNQSLQEIEKLIDNISTLTEKFQSVHTEYSKIPIVPLYDIPGLTHIQLEKRLGKPKISREGKRLYLAKGSYIDLANEDLAEYIELYLKSVQETLRDLTKPDILRVVRVPQDEKMVGALLSYNRELKVRKAELNQKRDEIDREIDRKVYELYGLSEEEVKTVEESF